MTDSPLVSVIIPTLNRVGLVRNALASLHSSSYQNVETLVVDQESEDTTLALLDSEGFPHITETVRGAGRARKAGLAHTSGELVLFLDSDDWLAPDAISALVTVLHSSSPDLAYGGSQSAHLDNLGRWRSSGTVLFAPLTSASMVRRSAFAEFGEFDDDNFSWPRWVIAARHRGLATECVDTLICHRGIHSGNVSKQEGATKELFSLVRNHRDGQAGIR
jgi:glycosyltransferase involved in cell wall biosynthesis